jgi:plasmid maintenance system antidote protein VapI
MDNVTKLQRWMAEKQVDAATLARRLGCTPPVLSYLLNRKRPLSADMAARLTKVTGLRFDER